MLEHKQPDPDRRAKALTAWAGVGLTVVAIAGLLVAPGARLIWFVILVFGVATIPQVLFWRHPRGDEAERDNERT